MIISEAEYISNNNIVVVDADVLVATQLFHLSDVSYYYSVPLKSWKSYFLRPNQNLKQ